MDISEMDIGEIGSHDDVTRHGHRLTGIGIPICPFLISCFSVIPPFLPDPVLNLGEKKFRLVSNLQNKINFAYTPTLLKVLGCAF
jgi:hypothetical protein